MNLVLAEAARRERIAVVSDGVDTIRTEHLDVALPDGHIILPDASLAIGPRDRILITGPTGVGKSTLFRALAGIWPFGKGEIQVPTRARALFIPQRAYLPIASLRDAVSYPAPTGTFDDKSLREVLSETGLGAFADRLDEVQNWSNRLSGGEQQRLAIARALLHRPDWLFLDEATAALDEDAEARMYTLLSERLPDAAIVSIAHRPGVAAFHTTRFSLVRDGLKRVAAAESTTRP
jgi:putative ATP-binding cassette transporter